MVWKLAKEPAKPIWANEALLAKFPSTAFTQSSVAGSNHRSSGSKATSEYALEVPPASVTLFAIVTSSITDKVAPVETTAPPEPLLLANTSVPCALFEMPVIARQLW